VDAELEGEVRRKRREIVRRTLLWGRDNVRDFPWRRDRTPYRVLVAEIILRRTTAKAACRVYGAFLRRYPDVYTLSRADVGELEALLSAIGYHKQRALILKEVAQFIVSKYNGVIPDRREDLEAIPHVGHYTAGAVLSLGYGIPSAMVDSNVERVIGRVFSRALPARGRKREVLEVAEAIVPREGHELFNLAMLDLGALVCRYRGEACQECPLLEVCDTGIHRQGGKGAGRVT
jgi:A/G-specific adenine glycosylase